MAEAIAERRLDAMLVGAALLASVALIWFVTGSGTAALAYGGGLLVLGGLGTSVEDAGKAMSVLSWLGFFVMYFVVALAVRLIERDGNRFARWHASEALNLQLTFVLLWNLVLGPVVIITMVTSIGSESQGPPAAFFLMLPVAGTLFITCAAGCIYGAVRAGRGDWWRCQFAIPFLRAHRRELDRVSAGNSDHAGPR